MKGVKESEGKLHIFSPMTVIQTDRQKQRDRHREKTNKKFETL